MPQDADEIVVGANGRVMAAPVGTVAPADAEVAFGAGWVDVGFVNEDGVTFRDSKTLKSIPVWQSFYAVRRIIEERDAQVEFVLRQWSNESVPLAFGGGAVTEPDPVGAPGQYRYEPPQEGDLDPRALAIEWVDGAKSYRLFVPKGLAIEEVETKLVRTDPADLPITFGTMPDSGMLPWYLLTNDPAFAAV